MVHLRMRIKPVLLRPRMRQTELFPTLTKGIVVPNEEVTREQFCSAFENALQVLQGDDISDVYVDRYLQVSRPTIGRWARGEAAPHPIGRKPILKAMIKLLEQQE